MAVAPFIKPITTRKGIMYTFQSANDDLTLTFNNNVNKARFTHFALLNIPVVGPPSTLYDNTLTPNNTIQFLAPGETPLIETLNTNQNINLAQSFQNYALNFESLLLSMPSHDRSLKKKVSERVFWKWLKELGAIHWRDANALEENTVNLPSGETRFSELTENATVYNRVVKYVGEIDVVNNVKTPDNSYSEVYIYVPTNVGTTPYVLFKTEADTNYFESMTVTNNPIDPLDIEYLSSRHYSDINPYGLSTRGYFDLTDGSVDTQIADIPSSYLDSPIYSAGNWFNGNIKYSYYTDSDFNIAKPQLITKTYGSETISYARNTLDGIGIDFDLNNYKLATEDPTIKTFVAFNDYVGNKNFDYNAILVYYEVYDPNNPTDSEINLYGIMFLNKFEQTGLDFQIPVIQKNMPDVVTKINGTAYAHKLNIKTDNSIEDVGVEKSINDYLTFSMDLYLDVLNAFASLQTSFNDKLLELTQLKADLQSATDSLLNASQLTSISQRVFTLEESFKNSQNYFESSTAFNGMLTKLSDDLNNFMQGNSSVEVSYNSDVIKQGDGISIVKKPNKVTINNTNQSFNINSNSIFNIVNFRTLPLSKFTNYYRHENETNTYTMLDNLTLRIDDSDTQWKTGQSFELVFSDPLNLNGFDLNIVTDANNITGNGEYGVVIATLSESDFGTEMTPIFRLTCINSNNLLFKVDKLR